MIPSYDQERLTEACELAKQTEKWTIGALISYVSERESTEVVWNWTVDDLRNYVYDRFVDELMSNDDLFMYSKRSGGSGGTPASLGLKFLMEKL